MTMLCYPCSKKWGAPITSRSTNLLIDWLINRWLQLFKLFKATNGENQPLVREEPVELDIYLVEVQDSGKLLIILRSLGEYTSILMKENHEMSTCNRLDLETLGSWPIMPKYILGHWSRWCQFCHCSKLCALLREIYFGKCVQLHFGFLGIWLGVSVHF